MKSTNIIAKAQISIGVSIDKVWDALVNPETIKKYMFGTTVISDWKEGSKIIWKGEWQKKPYEDKGEILLFRPKTKIQYSHFSPLSGLAETPENFHTVTIELTGNSNQTVVSLFQDNNATEEARKYSEGNWTMMLTGMKNLLEEVGN
jgi:uncharacterized protein YndB with AHSA1/START domain